MATSALTNMPGRIEISAANELDLSYAHIAGPNYLSVQASNQFDGSAGASIQAPYSDINIGVTNGFLTVSEFDAVADGQLEWQRPGLEHAMVKSRSVDERKCKTNDSAS